MYKNGVNFNIKNRNMIEDYLYLISRAVNESIENTNYFIKTILDYKNNFYLVLS